MSLRLPLALLLFTLAAPPAPAQQVTDPQDSTLTLRRDTHLVVLDVVVTDAKLNPVKGLHPEDFIITEKHDQQTIKNFEEHTAPTPAPQPPPLKLPPNTFTNYTPAPTSGPLNILLLDALNTPMKDQMYVRNQMLGFLKTVPAGTPLAIFGLTTHLTILQGFTSDPAVLRAVLNSKKGLPFSSPLMDSPVTGEDMFSDLGNTPNANEVSANLSSFEGEIGAIQQEMRAQYTLDAMTDLARYLSGIPGRKNLIWFSGSFPIDILPDGDAPDPFATVGSSEEQFRQTTDMLTQGQVAVYPVDSRGLMTLPQFSAATSGRQFARNPAAMGQSISAFNQQTFEEHSTMDMMAEDTGGKAFYNTNDLKSAVAKAIALGSYYYTLSYRPTNDKWNGDFRDVKVQLRTPVDGYQLFYRHGYYADDPSSATKKQPMHTAVAPAPNPMAAAMLRGAPDPTQIIFKTYIAEVSPTPDAIPATDNILGAHVHGPFLTYTLSYAVDPSNIAFQATPDGVYHGNIEVTAIVYDSQGTVLNSISQILQADYPTASYADALKHGIRTSQLVSVPYDPKHKQEFFLRIGVHDMSSDRVGALEVPLDSVHDVVSSAAPAPAKQ